MTVPVVPGASVPSGGADQRRSQSADMSTAANAQAGHALQAFASLLAMIVVALFLLTFVTQPFRIPSASMEPTLLVGDFLLVNKTVEPQESATSGSVLSRVALGPMAYQRIHSGDIVVFRYPPDPKIHVVKRVIGLPGDHIKMRNGVLYRNGKAQSEAYVMAPPGGQNLIRDDFPEALYTDPAVDLRWWMQVRRAVQNGEYVVPDGGYFVLGDNRSNSRDSRYWGLVPRQNIVGSPFLIYFSVRDEGGGELSSAPDVKLDHREDAFPPLTGFARWNRMFRVVR
ncbi:MAG TPA: signal peptidase I [Acidisarcina sp.]